MAFHPILNIFFGLIEFTPPCLGLNDITLYVTFSWNFVKQAANTALGRLKSDGINFKYFSTMFAFISRNGALASGTQTWKYSQM